MNPLSLSSEQLRTWIPGKRIGVVGLERTGVALTKLLVGRQATVVATDKRPLERLGQEVAQIDVPSVELRGGTESCPELRDCALVVISPGVPASSPQVEELQTLGVPVTGEIEFACRLIDNEILAISGTKGKSTTASLLGDMFLRDGCPCVVCGNIGVPLSGQIDGLCPQARVVLEVSSFQLETVDRFHPRQVALVSLSEDHLDRHASFEEYVQAKLRVLGNLTEGDQCYFADETALLRQQPLPAGVQTVWYSVTRELTEGGWLTEAGDLYCRTPQWDGVLCAQSQLQLLGKHNAGNALCASLMALHNGVSPDAVRASLTTFTGLPHRLQRVVSVDGVTYWNDSMATTPASAAAGLRAMSGPTTIIVGGVAKTQDFSDLVTAAVETGARALCFGQSASLLEEQLCAGGVERVSRCTSLQEAVETAHAASSAGEHVLLAPACSSFDMFDSYADRGDQFKALALQLAGQTGLPSPETSPPARGI